MFQQYILAGYADIGSAITHIGGYIRGTDNDQFHVGLVGIKDQLAAGFRVINRFDTGRSEQRQRLFKDAALGKGDGQCSIHGVKCQAESANLQAPAASLPTRLVISHGSTAENTER